MALVNVKNRLGTNFRVSGAYLFPKSDPEEKAYQRTVQGSFMVTVNATSAQEAMLFAALQHSNDIVVHKVEML